MQHGAEAQVTDPHSQVLPGHSKEVGLKITKTQQRGRTKNYFKTAKT